jgi:hypothetical protein
VRLAKTEPEQARFHLVNPKPLAWGDLVETVIALGYPLRLVSHSRWHSMLQDLVAHDERTTFLHYLAAISGEEMAASLRGGYATEVTSRALGADFEWPPVDASMLRTYLRAMANAGRFSLGLSPKRPSMMPSVKRSSDRLLASGR